MSENNPDRHRETRRTFVPHNENNAQSHRDLNHARKEPPGDLRGICFPFGLEQFLHLFVFRLCPADANAQCPHPPEGPDQDRRPGNAERSTCCHPAARREVGKRESSDDENRASVRGVPDVSIET